MASLEHRTLSPSNLLAGRESLPYVRSRPQEIVNYSLTTLLLDLIVALVAVFLTDTVMKAHLFDLYLSDAATPIILLTPIIWFAVFLAMPFPSEEQPQTLSDEMRRAVAVAIIASFIMLAIGYVADIPLPHPFLWLTGVFSLIGVIGWRLLVRMAFPGSQPRFPKRVLIAGNNERTRHFADRLSNDTDAGTIICGFLADDDYDRLDNYPVLGSCLDDIQVLIEHYRIDDVVIAIPDQRDDAFNRLFEVLQLLPVNLYIIPEYPDLDLHRGEDMLVVKSTRIGITLRARVIKRLFDIGAASFGLLLILPALLLVAVAVKLDSPGPVFFKQLRVGEHCHRFRMYKFRSMVQNAEKLQTAVNTFDENGNLIHKTEHDPRVTRVGRIIRKYSIDELPQLINVLLGDMTLVGPRPEMPWIVNHYEMWQYQRFLVPQGITGWWQVNGRSEKPMHMATEEDIYYIRNYSLLLDFRILVKTVSVVFTGKGAF